MCGTFLPPNTTSLIHINQSNSNQEIIEPQTLLQNQVCQTTPCKEGYQGFHENITIVNCVVYCTQIVKQSTLKHAWNKPDDNDNATDFEGFGGKKISEIKLIKTSTSYLC